MIPHGSATRIWWLCVSDSVALKRRNNHEDSMNYLNICTVIDELKEINHFNEAQNLKILNTAIQNKQIKSFINEKNVKEFYCKILDNVDPESDISKKVKKLFT